jgi:CTP:molybdopterin cytidylyltransferase MocA
MIAGLVLAAGTGSRFGGAKVVAPLHGTAIVRHVVARLLDAGLTPVVVVAGSDRDAIAHALEGADVEVIVNPNPESGLSSSLRLGVDALPDYVGAFVVALGDQPLIEPAVVRSLIDAWNQSNVAAVVPEYRDGRGNPVLFDATLRRRMAGLTGDVGARHLLEQLGDRVGRVSVDANAPRDVDTRADLESLEG